MAGLVAFRLAVLLHQALHNWSASRMARRAKPALRPETLDAGQPAR
jgi:hypothetical protein